MDEIKNLNPGEGLSQESLASGNRGDFSIMAEEEVAGQFSVGLGEGQSLIPNPIKKKEADEAYLNNGQYDEDQELTLQILREEGRDIENYVTPNNSPEQMFEIANALEIGMEEDKLKKMADPQISYMALQAVNRAWKAGIDLTEFLPWADPLVLNQAILAAKRGLDLSKLIKPGLDHRQIEQIRKEIESGGDPNSLSGNYNQMRAQRFPGHNISNSEKKIPSGMGTSQKKKGAREEESNMDNKTEVAVESFPQAVIDYLEKKYTRLDGTGKVVNVGRVNKLKKRFGDNLSNKGISLQNLDFDLYLSEGIQFDRFPSKAITVIEYEDNRGDHGFYIYDGRSSNRGNENKISVLVEADGRLYDPGKGKYREYWKIPNKQFLKYAKKIWVIPEEDLEDITQLRAERSKRTQGVIGRRRPEEIHEWARDDYDKSGYPKVTKWDIQRRLRAFREKKASRDPVVYINEELLKVVQTYNELAKKLYNYLGQRIDLNDIFSESTQEEKKISQITLSARDSLVRIKTKIEGLTSDGDKKIDTTSYQFSSLVSDLGGFFKRGGDGYDLLLLAESFGSFSSTEGQSTLGGTKGYFINNSLFEED